MVVGLVGLIADGMLSSLSASGSSFCPTHHEGLALAPNRVVESFTPTVAHGFDAVGADELQRSFRLHLLAVVPLCRRRLFYCNNHTTATMVRLPQILRPPADRDEEDVLAREGYKQELNRNWSVLHNFGVSFSIIVGTLQSVAAFPY